MSDDFERDLEGEESENDMSDEELLRRKSSLDDDFAEADELGAEAELDPLANDPLAEDEPESLDELAEEEDEDDEWDDVEPDEMEM